MSPMIWKKKTASVRLDLLGTSRNSTRRRIDPREHQALEFKPSGHGSMQSDRDTALSIFDPNQIGTLDQIGLSGIAPLAITNLQNSPKLERQDNYYPSSSF